MAPLLVMSTLVGAWLVYLVIERMRLERHRRAVPLRIAVTGTRGKTTVTRRLAAVLGKDGRAVLAKTTGSEADYLFPDGSVQEIHRLGAPSIIEQKRLLRRGAQLGVDAVVAEVMSLHPENHLVEVQRILKPHMVLVTNFRVDHMEAQGETRREVASVLALDVPPGVAALVPEAEWEEGFQELVTKAGGTVVKVPAGESQVPEECGGFGPNLDLVWAAARSLGVVEEVIRDGICQAEGDIGALRSWRFAPDGSGDSWLLVSAFAANDPESTIRIYDRVTERQGVRASNCVGLLSLRADRGDRSLQWAEALQAGTLENFRTLFVSGLHAHAVKYRLRKHPEADRIRVLRPGPPAEIMEELLAGGIGGGEVGARGAEAGREGGTRERGGAGVGRDGQESLGLLFGFGNIAGLGRTMVQHWRKVGEPYGI